MNIKESQVDTPTIIVVGLIMILSVREWRLRNFGRACLYATIGLIIIGITVLNVLPYE